MLYSLYKIELTNSFFLFGNCIMINSCEKLTVEITPDTKQSTVKCSRRKDVDYNAFEQVFTLCLCDSALTTKDDILKTEYAFNFWIHRVFVHLQTFALHKTQQSPLFLLCNRLVAKQDTHVL